MARNHVMTPARKLALKKAQRESALKRKHGAKYRNLKTRAHNKNQVRKANLIANGVQVAIAGGIAAHSLYKARVEYNKANFKHNSQIIRGTAHNRRGIKSGDIRQPRGTANTRPTRSHSPFSHKGGKTKVRYFGMKRR